MARCLSLKAFSVVPFVLLGAVLSGPAQANEKTYSMSAESSADASMLDPALSLEQIAELTEEAFYWGLSIAGYYEYRYVTTQQEGQPAYVGINRLRHNLELFDAKVRFATTVNASTLYSGGLFDVREQPMVIEADAVEDGRYWSIQPLDHHVDWFFMAGSQFTGNHAQRYIIVGPDWTGEIPDAFRSTQIIKSPSNSFSLTIRVAVTDRTEEDLEAARRVIRGIKAAPLDHWISHGESLPELAQQPIVKADYASFPRMDHIADIGKTMTAIDYLQLLSLAINDPSITLRNDSVKEVHTLQRLARLGLRQGAPFDSDKLSAEQRQAIEKGFLNARDKARLAFEKSATDMNGWSLQSSLFYDDLDYVAKAGANDVAWGTPVPYQSHTIGYVFKDSEGRPLLGKHQYTLTFDIDNLPPVTEFWELPVYDEQGYFIDNPIDRYSATSYLHQAGKYHVEDGKLTFYFQSEEPESLDHARNWLPISADTGFQIAARFYGPMASLIDGTYPMPQLVRQEER